MIMTRKNDCPLDNSPLHLLHRAGQCADTLFQSEISALDVTPRQYAALLAVAKSPGSSQSDLVTATGIDRSTMADLIRRLEKRGLVRRRRTREDARAYAIALTEEGQRVLKAAVPAATRADAKLLAAMMDQQARAFVDYLSTIIDAFHRGESQRLLHLPETAVST